MLSSSLPVEHAHPEPPEPHEIRTLALNAVEAIQSMRPLEPLAKLLTGEVYERLRMQRTLRQDRKAVYRDDRRIVPMPGRVITSMPHEHKVHSVVIMHTGTRSFAVVVRFEWHETRWRASELAVL